MLKEFIALVANMRQEQKAFFASKDVEERRIHLQESKRLERQVDEFLRRYSNDCNETLFSNKYEL